MTKQVLITGTSSGIGYGLALAFCKQGANVLGVSRSDCDLANQFPNYQHYNIDLTDYNALSQNFAPIINEKLKFDLIILNAGVLGKISSFPEQSVEEAKRVMDINVWANKALIDLFLNREVNVKQWVAISSGAAKNGSAGWGSYSVSKAALNMLIQTYAVENPKMHFCALAPGLVDTQMQDYISAHPNKEGFPTVDRLRAAKGTTDMPDPIAAGPMLINAMQKALEYDSGMFLDVRNF